MGINVQQKINSMILKRGETKEVKHGSVLKGVYTVMLQFQCINSSGIDCVI